MHRRAFTTLVLLHLPEFAFAQPSVQRSHIEANVPAPEQFQQLLDRDLLAYFHAVGFTQATSVQVRLLRDGPTQSGAAYPKYYAWVRAHSGATKLTEGAVRLTAVDRVRFEVTNYVAKGSVTRPVVEAVFPRPLVPEILRLAAE